MQVWFGTLLATILYTNARFLALASRSQRRRSRRVPLAHRVELQRLAANAIRLCVVPA
jgi:hypothetical protein